jgi:hypothetical protein
MQMKDKPPPPLGTDLAMPGAIRPAPTSAHAFDPVAGCWLLPGHKVPMRAATCVVIHRPWSGLPPQIHPCLPAPTPCKPGPRGRSTGLFQQ